MGKLSNVTRLAKGKHSSLFIKEEKWFTRLIPGKFFPQIVDEDAAHMDTTLLTRVLLLRLSFAIGWGRFTAAKVLFFASKRRRLVRREITAIMTLGCGALMSASREPLLWGKAQYH
jgi:hypothetical protein